MYDENDRIPREAALEAVDIALYYLGIVKISMDIKDVDVLISHMQDIRKQIESMKYKSDWIPCSERLPEEGNTTYMTTLDYGELGRATGQRFFYGKDIGWEDDAVVAWMPLPNPYKC